MSRKAYKSELTDAEWLLIEPLIPPAKTGGHPRTVNMREIINGIFYVLKTGCSWEMLPNDLPPSSTVYYYFRLFTNKGVWLAMNRQLRRQARKGFGRNELPTVASADSQSIKTTAKRGKCMVLMAAKRSKGENAIF